MAKYIFSTFLVLFTFLNLDAQQKDSKGSFLNSNFSQFPSTNIEFHTRSWREIQLNRLELKENGKKIIPTSISKISSQEVFTRNKIILILVQNHYSSKGISQRSFFKNLLKSGLANSVNPGDKILIATFDWYRNEKYIFFPITSDFTDNVDDLNESIEAISSPIPLSNSQKGSDIYAALNESLDFLSSVKDTLSKSIILLSDDFPNIVSTIVPADIKRKSLEKDIPVYAISYNINTSRYNLTTQNEICIPSNGDYFLSVDNDAVSSSEKFEEYLKLMSQRQLGASHKLVYKSDLKRTGEVFSLQLNIVGGETVELNVKYPFNPIEWIKEKPLLFLLYLLILLIIFLSIYFLTKRIKKEKAKKIQLQQEQAKSIEEGKIELAILQQEQSLTNRKYEKDKIELSQKIRDEKLRNIFISSGKNPKLNYTYQGRSVIVPIKDFVTTIGRLPENDLVLQFPFMSKKHLKIELSEDGYFYVFDLNSTNGTLLNNVRISNAKLQNGDILSIGLVDIKFIL
jgi:hypothetical protein